MWSRAQILENGVEGTAGDASEMAAIEFAAGKPMTFLDYPGDARRLPAIGKQPKQVLNNCA
jgi:hypothetical protein